MIKPGPQGVVQSRFPYVWMSFKLTLPYVYL
jgi:hypothetical protein